MRLSWFLPTENCPIMEYSLPCKVRTAVDNQQYSNFLREIMRYYLKKEILWLMFPLCLHSLSEWVPVFLKSECERSYFLLKRHCSWLFIGIKSYSLLKCPQVRILKIKKETNWIIFCWITIHNTSWNWMISWLVLHEFCCRFICCLFSSWSILYNSILYTNVSSVASQSYQNLQ